MTRTGHILLLCQHFYPEMISTGMHMTELSLALRKLRWEITVCCAQPSLSFELKNYVVPNEIELEGIRIVRVPAIGSHSKKLIDRLMFGITYLISCALFVAKNFRRFDGLVVTTNPPLLGMVGYIASKLLGKHYVMIVYDIYPNIVMRLGLIRPSSLIYRLWDSFSCLVFRHAACNVVIGRDMQEIVAMKLGSLLQTKICLIPNWSDDEVVYPVPRNQNAFRQETCPDNQLLIQYSGRMARTHNLEPLIMAAELLKDAPVLFQFIGDGAKKSVLMELVSAKGLTNVQFLPYQPIGRLKEVLSAADVAVVCLDSQYTGLSVPSKTYGIMASATPLLGLIDTNSEIGLTIEENACGVVLAKHTPEQVADIIIGWLADRSRLKEMGYNGYVAFKKKYTLTIATQRYSDLLSRCFGLR